MPTFRLITPGEPDELVQADSARREGLHTVLRGTVLVMGRPREVVVRRASRGVRVVAVDDHGQAPGWPGSAQRGRGQQPT